LAICTDPGWKLSVLGGSVEKILRSVGVVAVLSIEFRIGLVNRLIASEYSAVLRWDEVMICQGLAQFDRGV
jgi:hypothetical protein